MFSDPNRLEMRVGYLSRAIVLQTNYSDLVCDNFRSSPPIFLGGKYLELVGDNSRTTVHTCVVDRYISQQCVHYF